MARYRGAVCRLCRREGMKLFLKGERCFGPKCAIEKRNFAPGAHGKARRSRIQGYGLQLREKQKVKRTYGLLEKQFRLYFLRAERTRGITGEVLLQSLERRLDNTVYRLGFATSRPQARLLVRHGHVRVGERRVNIPSFSVREGDVVSVSPKYAAHPHFQYATEMSKSRGVPKWLEVGEAGTSGRVVALPSRDDLELQFQEQLIVELYSK
ncbi:MAG TPA: 30S ribosomal protein S4 [Vicinamibacteria bacterium]|nr:30S ribosomal protein S4 [Vicinamibacteria bacterium]